MSNEVAAKEELIITVSQLNRISFLPSFDLTSLLVFLQLKQKEERIEQDGQKITELELKLAKNRELLKPITQNLVDTSKVNFEQTNKIRALQEKLERMKIASIEKENKEKKLLEILAEKDEEIAQLKNKRVDDEINELKLKVEDRDEKLIAMVQLRNREFAKTNQNLEKNHQQLRDATQRIETLKNQADIWYTAYGALRSEMIELRKQKLTPSSEL